MMWTYKCTHCGAEKQTDYPSGPIDYHHKACSDAGYYNRMEEVPDRVRRQEEARGWHRQPQPQITEDDMVPPGTMYALNFNSIKPSPEVSAEVSAASLLETLQWWYGNTNFAPDAKEYEHDRRLRGQYE